MTDVLCENFDLDLTRTRLKFLHTKRKRKIFKKETCTQ